MINRLLCLLFGHKVKYITVDNNILAIKPIARLDWFSPHELRICNRCLAAFWEQII